MRVWQRPSLLSAGAMLSAALLAVTLVGWGRSYPHSGCLGWGRVRQATPEVVAVDSYTLQCSRGQVWCGRCGVSVLTIPGFRSEPGVVAAGLESVARYLNVFEIPEFAGPLSGIGAASGATVEVVGHGFLRYEISGVVVPCWLLALVTGFLPALWVCRWMRCIWRGGVPANSVGRTS